MKEICLVTYASDNDEYNVYCNHYILPLSENVIERMDRLLEDVKKAYEFLPSTTSTIKSSPEYIPNNPFDTGYFIYADPDEEKLEEFEDEEWRVMELDLDDFPDNPILMVTITASDFSIHKDGSIYALSDGDNGFTCCSSEIDWEKVKEAYYGQREAKGTPKD